MKSLYWLVGGALLAGALVYSGVVRVGVLASTTDPNVVHLKQANGADVQIEVLFEHDGCKMYSAYYPQTRSALYWTKCSGGTSQVSWNTSEFDPATETTVPKPHSVISNTVK